MAAEASVEGKKWSWNAQQLAPLVAGDHVFCDALRVSLFSTTDPPHGRMLTLRGAWGRPVCAPPWRAPEQHPTHPAPLPAALHRNLQHCFWSARHIIQGLVAANVHASVKDGQSRRPSYCPQCWVDSVSTPWSWWAFWQQEAHPPLTRALQRLEPLLALLGGVQQLGLARLALLSILAQPATSCRPANSQVTTIKSPQLRDVTGNTHPSEALHSVF